MVRRVEVKPDDVAHLLDEEGIVGELEVALAVRLHAEQVEPALHGGLGYAGVLGHAAHAPLRGVGRLDLEGGVDHVGNPFVLVGAGPPGTQFVVQALKAPLPVAAAPLADGDVAQPHALGDGGVGLAFGAGQHDLRPLHHRVGQ